MGKGKKRADKSSGGSRGDPAGSAEAAKPSKETQQGGRPAQASVTNGLGRGASGKQKERITDYFSPARSPVTADDADSAAQSITATQLLPLCSSEPHQHVMKSARLTRTSSTEACMSLAPRDSPDVEVISSVTLEEPSSVACGQKCSSAAAAACAQQQEEMRGGRATTNTCTLSDAESDDCVVIEDTSETRTRVQGTNTSETRTGVQGTNKIVHDFSGFVNSVSTLCAEPSYPVRQTRSRALKHSASRGSTMAALKAFRNVRKTSPSSSSILLSSTSAVNSAIMNGGPHYSCCSSASSSCSNSSCGSSMSGSSCHRVCDICDESSTGACNGHTPSQTDGVAHKKLCHSASCADVGGPKMPCECWQKKSPLGTASQSPNKRHHGTLASGCNGVLTDQNLLYSAVQSKRSAMMLSLHGPDFDRASLLPNSSKNVPDFSSPRKRNHSDCTSPKKYPTPEVEYVMSQQSSPVLLSVDISNRGLIPSPSKRAMQSSVRNCTSPKNAAITKSPKGCASISPPVVVDLTVAPSKTFNSCPREQRRSSCDGASDVASDDGAAVADTAFQPRLNHSSPTVRKLFVDGKDGPPCDASNRATDLSEAATGGSPTKGLPLRPTRTCLSPTSLRSAALNDAVPNIPPHSPSLPPTSASTPSTPHKIQVIEDAGDLFLSPSTNSAISRLSVSSPCGHIGTAARRPKGRGRKRPNALGCDHRAEVIKITGEVSGRNGGCDGGRPRRATRASCGANTGTAAAQGRPGAAVSRVPVAAGGDDKKLNSSSKRNASLNGFVRPMTRNAKMLQQRPHPNNSDDLKISSANTYVSSDDNVSDLTNDKANEKTKGSSVETVDFTSTNPTSVKNRNAQMTDYFPIRRSERKPKATLMYERQMDIEKKILSGSEEGLRVEQFGEKGRGVVTTRLFRKGEFVVEYVGELLDVKDAKVREHKYAMDATKGCYMYYFVYNDVQYCIDGTEETGYLGRLVNHSRTNNNLVTKSVCVDGRPHLILLAKKDIPPGTELLYDYGDRSKEALANHPWLAF